MREKAIELAVYGKMNAKIIFNLLLRWLCRSSYAVWFFLQVVLIMGLNQIGYSQGTTTINERYPFIRYELNNISFPGDSTSYLKFMDKFKLLSDSQQGQINIVQIGGSHVQADLWTGKVRENFNRYLDQKESSRGMIFPYRAVKTNGALQFDVSYDKAWEGFRNVRLFQPENMGLMGWKATARDSGQYVEVTLKGDTISSFYFDHLRIFHDNGEQSFPFTITIDDSVYTPQFFESCLCSEVALQNKANKFMLTVHQTDSIQTGFVLHGIQTSLREPGLTFHSIGVNGASVSSYLHCRLFEQQLAYVKPDLIIFSIGINDSFSNDFTSSGFEANYSELIRRIRLTCPDVAIIFVTNTDSYKRVKRQFYKNLKGKEVQKSMHNLGREHGAAFWDLYGVMGGLSSISKWKHHGMANRDLIHLNRRGYHQVGDLFFDAFIKSYDLHHQTP